MSTSLLYHAFGIRGYQYTRTDYQGGQMIFTIHQGPETCRCSACGSARVIRAARSSANSEPCLSAAAPHSWSCPSHALNVRPVASCARSRSPSPTRGGATPPAFERYALELGRRMTIRDVAVHLGVGWDVIKDIQKRDLSRRFAKPKLKHLRHIAIDEIAIAKGHRYLTVVMDLESGAVVFVGDGKGADALKPFWKRLAAARPRSQAVAMDMSAAYRRAVATNLPKAKIVFDRFHVVKLFNEKLSDLRRALHREATDVLQKKVLKGTRWLLLKNPENLDAKRRTRSGGWRRRLALNKSLATAYYMKEDLRQFWEQPGKRFATAFLDELDSTGGGLGDQDAAADGQDAGGAP